MKQIEHDPNEPKIDRSKGGWLSTFAVLGLAWAGYIYSFDVDWYLAAGAAATGAAVMAWAIEYTGNKVPDSWRKKP